MAASLNDRFITSLNNDIFITIFEHMNVEDLKNICLVNSRFYELVTTTPSVNKQFKLNVNSNYNATIIEALMESNRYFENISIPILTHRRYGEPCKPSQIIDLMKKFGGRVKNIEFMQFKGRKYIIECPKSIFELLQMMPNIESLMIFPKYISSECFERLPKSTIFQFNQLKEIHAPFTMIFSILKHVNTLEELDVFIRTNNDAIYGTCLEFIEILRNNQSTLKSLKLNTRQGLFKHDIQVLFLIFSIFLIIKLNHF